VSELSQVGVGRLAQDAPVSEAIGLVAAAGLGVCLHLFAGNLLLASGTGEQHVLADLEPPVGGDDQLAAAGEGQVRRVRKLADQPHFAVAHRGGKRHPVGFRADSVNCTGTSAAFAHSLVLPR